MKFVKIYLPSVPDADGKSTSEYEWRCVIGNMIDLFAYANFERELFAQAFFQIKRTSDGKFDAAHAGDKRTRALATLLNVRAERLKEGEKFHPMIETAKIHAQKIKSMMKLLERGYSICINSTGGFCDLEEFLKTWKAEIVETIEKDDQSFPVDAEALTAATLILENQDNVSNDFLRIVSERTETKPEIIIHLKEKDKKWIYKSMMNAKTLAFSSTFRNELQLTNFLNILSEMPRKQIIVGFYGNDIEKLVSHPLYNETAAKHSVQLVGHE